jgi:hypothetical protein
MQQIIKNLEATINTSIKQYIKNIHSKYPTTNPETLFSIWKDLSKEVSVDEEDKSCQEDKSSQEPLCPYPFSKGSKAGTVCNIKPKNGSIYCSAHKKFEGQEPKPKKVIPEPKKPNSPKDAPTPIDTKPIFHTHKTLNILYHRETGMVIKSTKEPIVIGKLNKEIITPLTPEDIEICKKMRFKYDTQTDLSTFNRSKSSNQATVNPTPKPIIKPTAKPESDEEVESEEEEDSKKKPAQISKPQPQLQPKPTPKPTAKADSDEEVESEEEEDTKKKPAQIAKTQAKPIIKATAKPTPKPTPKHNSDPESDEEIIDEDIEDIIEDLSDGEVQTKIVKKAFGVKKEEDSDSD